ncbi:MAG: reprolysin-like metallopeptidase, partial [Ferruginibacter sp.]
MKKNLLLTVLFAIFTALGFSQSGKYWSLHNGTSGTIVTDKAVARHSFPKEFKIFDLSIAPLRQQLFSIINQPGQSTVISLPNTDGNIEQFEVFEASNFENALQVQFPEIRAYSGKGITDRSARLKLSISPRGIQTMVFRTEKQNEFIEAYSQDHTIYAVFRSQRAKGQLGWTCSTLDSEMMSSLNNQIQNTSRPTSNTGEMKTIRLAQSCNGEYSNYFGATSAAQVALVLAAFNATLTRCNGVYETDLALHLNLIANTTDVIYYTPGTDPYTTLPNWNGQLQATLTSVIGEANYDLGHMFGASGGGGNAGCIGCVCVNGQKGSGITSPADAIPEGDNFDIDYVVHEVGHQLGANHTFSMNLEGTGQNKEVGSGITIMGYAGITNQDVAPHSIDIFHETSIQQIQVNLAAKTCPITTNISAANATPVVAPVANYIIPKSTPFALTGSGTDANATDVLTYCWEQNDNATTSGNNSVASPTKLTGPNWLSFSPTTNPTRTCPILATILAGNFITGPLPGGDAIANIEALSSVARVLNFRLTVRDNSPYVPTVKIGQTAFTDMSVTVNATAGPFGVSIPNTPVSWAGNSTQTVTWTVNGSDLAPVSCANVSILLSTDGGFTFPTTLIASTPNDGSETVTIPNTATTTARIKVQSIGNIFFDISNTNFTITALVSGFSFNATTATTIGCGGPTTAAVTLGTTANGSFVTPIVLTATAG